MKTEEQPENRHDILERLKEEEKKSKAEHLQPWQYKKGQSGNPSGRAPGISLKEYARMKFRTMTDEEREEFFNGIPKIDLFKMAEGNPKQDVESQVNAVINVIVPEAVAKSFNINATHEETGTDNTQ